MYLYLVIWILILKILFEIRNLKFVIKVLASSDTLQTLLSGPGVLSQNQH